MMERCCGFNPVYDKDSRLLILGSFPSVKSRAIEFYYCNKQNRFWKVICSYFNEDIPDAVEDKRNFLLRHKIALWDIVTECDIDGSKDDSIKNFKVADIGTLLKNSSVEYIILNGGKAYEIFCKYYGDIAVPYIKLPSTSPANTHFSMKEWYSAISQVITTTQ